jgi:Cu+-exporting ATPase
MDMHAQPKHGGHHGHEHASEGGHEHHDHHGHEHHGHEHGHPHGNTPPGGHGAHQAESPAAAVPDGTVYTCPMHPEVRQDHPGNCPKCGMTLEPVLPTLDEDENPELADFRRRFWWTLPLTLLVTLLAMVGHRLQWFEMATQSWIELVLSCPSCCGPAGRSSCAAFSRCATAARTCGR